MGMADPIKDATAGDASGEEMNLDNLLQQFAQCNNDDVHNT